MDEVWGGDEVEFDRWRDTWTDDAWALDQIRSHIAQSFDAGIGDNPERVQEIVNGYFAGRLILIFRRDGMRIAEATGKPIGEGLTEGQIAIPPATE